MITRIHGHTVDMSLLNGLPILDAGCRYFEFAEYFAKRGHRVIALDPAPDIPDYSGKAEFIRSALNINSGYVDFSTWDGPEANRITEVPDPRSISILATSLKDLMAEKDVKHWDVVKLDIEGGEYDILMNWPGPIANQITVEFHEHLNVNPMGAAYYSKMLNHLEQWYRPAQHVSVPCDCGTGFNYWDSLFVLK